MEEKGITLMEWIKKTGLTVEYFACKIKADKSYVYKLMKGGCVPSPELMKKITKATLGNIKEIKDLVS